MLRLGSLILSFVRYNLKKMLVDFNNLASVNFRKRQMDHKCQPPQPTYDRSHSEEGWDISSVKTEIKITDSDINLISSRDQIRRYWLEFINCFCLIIFSKGSVAPCVRRNSSKKII